MFWIGFTVGTVIGGTIGAFIIALCNAASRGDDNECKNSYRR